jgi:hypothetical protein
VKIGLESQRGSSPSIESDFDAEYKYIVEIKAWEAFKNVMRREGIVVPEGAHTSFTTGKRLDMKSYQENGLIWAYSIIRVRSTEEVIEEGFR